MQFIRNNKIVIIFLSGVIIVAGYYIFKSDSFQRNFFPENYWQKVIESSESVIEFNNGLIRSAYRDLKKIQLTARIEIADSVDSAELTGLTKKDARDMAIQEIKDRIEENQQLIKELTEFNEKCKRDIETANN
jgi:hypothetical protein